MGIKPETKIVDKIKKKLNSLDKNFFFKVHGGLMQMAGISDLIGVSEGRFVAIEVKTPNNKKGATALQKWFLNKINSCGGIAFVARDLETVLIQLGVENG